MRKSGILLIREISFKGTDHVHFGRELYLPVFHEDCEFVSSILTEAMPQWKLREKKDDSDSGMDFYLIADTLGRKKTRSEIFIGMESIPYETPDSILGNASYVFTVDFDEGKIVRMK